MLCDGSSGGGVFILKIKHYHSGLFVYRTQTKLLGDIPSELRYVLLDELVRERAGQAEEDMTRLHQVLTHFSTDLLYYLDEDLLCHGFN